MEWRVTHLFTSFFFGCEDKQTQLYLSFHLHARDIVHHKDILAQETVRTKEKSGTQEEEVCDPLTKKPLQFKFLASLQETLGNFMGTRNAQKQKKEEKFQDKNPQSDRLIQEPGFSFLAFRLVVSPVFLEKQVATQKNLLLKRTETETQKTSWAESSLAHWKKFYQFHPSPSPDLEHIKPQSSGIILVQGTADFSLLVLSPHSAHHLPDIRFWAWRHFFLLSSHLMRHYRMTDEFTPTIEVWRPCSGLWFCDRLNQNPRNSKDANGDKSLKLKRLWYLQVPPVAFLAFN